MNQQVIDLIERHELFLRQTIQQLTVSAPDLKTAIDYTLFPGGKRLRPVLVYLFGELLDLELNCLDPIAAAIEITHCYSLIHDDLPSMDNDDYRRGKLSCHRVFGEATAILVGDGMQPLALELLLSKLPNFLPPATINAIILELVKASGFNGMVAGQCLDLSELHRENLTLSELCTIHQLKTGKLIRACVEMVIAAKGISTLETAHLRQYAKLLGLVFQMQDDYLDRYAPASLGKKRASDEANKKTTFANLFDENTLLEHINQKYQEARDNLTIFASKAANLLALTHYLHQRTAEKLTRTCS